MRDAIEKNAYEIAKLVSAGCFCLGCLLLVAAGSKNAEMSDWVASALRMWGFSASAAAIAIFIDGRRQTRGTREARGL